LPVIAGTATTSLTVNANVAAVCTISTTPVAFGTYNPLDIVDKEATGTVVVACAKNTPATNLWVSLTYPPATFSGTPRMLGQTSGDFLPYNLYQPSSNTPGAACTSPHASGTIWGNSPPGPGTYGSVLALTSPTNKNPRTYNVCGTIPAGYDAAVDTNYLDTVTAQQGYNAGVTGSIRVRCTGSSPPVGGYILTLSAGNSGNYNARYLLRSGEPLSYNLYRDALRQQIWGDTSPNVVSITANGNTTSTVYGRITPGQDIGVGSYNDTITATINF